VKARLARLGLCAAMLAGASGCGYALVGRGVAVDPSIKKVGVPLFRDTTGKTGLDQMITRRVIEELLRRGRFDVVQQATGVDALVDGEITGYIAQPVGFESAAIGQQAQSQASRYAVTVTARVRYTKTATSEPIWANESFTFRDEYDVGSDPTAFTDQESQALGRISQAFARTLVAAMLEAF
jgi:lipopolysaccharide assembly LptE-like protein